MLDLVRDRARGAGLTNVTAIEGDMNALDQLPVSSGPFDAVICVLGLFFADDMVKAVESMWRRVGPGGVLGITA